MCALFVDRSPWVIKNLEKDREILWFFVHMDALAPIGLVRVPQLGFPDHICKHCGATTEVVGVDAEEQSSAHEDDIAGSKIKLWVLRYDAAFVWRWDVGIDERRVPRSFGQCWGSGEAEIRVVHPPFQVEEENFLEELRHFSLCGVRKAYDY
jgi:hypothetical protein